MSSPVSTDVSSPQYVPIYKGDVDMGRLYSLRTIQHRIPIRYQASSVAWLDDSVLRYH